jgi:hypothetical protein
MSEQGKLISRQEVYEAVWQHPISKLAPMWNTKPANIVDACNRMNIPRPGSGHWALVRRGWEIKRPALPALGQGATAEVTIGPGPTRKPKRDSGEQIEVDQPQYEVVPVSETLHGAHVIISKVRRTLAAEKPGRSGVVEVPYRLKVLNVVVSRAQTNRALRILDAVLKALERRGGKFVESDEKDLEFMSLRIAEDYVGFELTEIVDKSEREPKDEEERESWSWKWDKWQYSATGRLRFRIFASEPKGARRSWADCTLYQLEEKLGEIVHWMFVTADGVRRERLAREEYWRRVKQERERKEAEQRRLEKLRKEEERKQQIEEQNRCRLEESSQAWFDARRLRRFIRACEVLLQSGGGSLPAEGWQREWLAWAREHADRLDPMTNGFLEREHERITETGDDTDEAEPAEPSLGQVMQDLMFGKGWPG